MFVSNFSTFSNILFSLNRERCSSSPDCVPVYRILPCFPGKRLLHPLLHLPPLVPVVNNSSSDQQLPIPIPLPQGEQLPLSQARTINQALMLHHYLPQLPASSSSSHLHSALVPAFKRPFISHASACPSCFCGQVCSPLSFTSSISLFNP